MACCVLAAFLLAQAMETLRRWGMFWGIVRAREGETVDTLAGRIRRVFARPLVRRGVCALVAAELLAVGSWTYVRHGEHIAQLVDIGWSRLHGQQIVYAPMCSMTGANVVRRVVRQSHDG